ncbi:MAG: cyclic nucleotide-binding domain-containing protein, partial [Alphaproteobacteria bacterium]|nr:cyclic nucleotide-binding domain-containing protein [Alphaproteobacteria bacterium]
MSIGETLPRQIFPAGAQIFSEGDDGRFAYVIEGGQVEISTFNNGRRVVIARLENGELLGEMALVDDTPRSATAVAVEDTQVVVIDRASLQQYIDSADELVQLLLRVTLERLRATQQVMLDETASTLGSKCRASHVRERDKLNSDLQDAIDRELLDLHFQPIV